jgi:TRAP-type transport system periplasmic protein
MKNLFLTCSLLLSINVFSKDIVVKFGTVAPAGTPWADTLDEIKKRVGKESGKTIKIKNYLGGQLGGELEILNGIRRGRIQGGGITSAALGSVITEMNVLEIPFIFNSYEEADYILDNFLLNPFRKLFKKKGLIFVSWAENGWRNIGLKNKLVKKPQDLKGVKVRSQNAIPHMEFWKKVEANAVPIEVPEVLSALNTGVVEGFDNTALFTLAAEWQTAIKYFSITEHIYQPAAVVYSAKFWNKMDDGQKKILMGPGNNMAAPSRASVRALGAELTEILKDMGIHVYKLSKSERDEFKKVIGNLQSEIVSKLGGESKSIYDLILKGKEAFKNK